LKRPGSRCNPRGYLSDRLLDPHAHSPRSVGARESQRRPNRLRTSSSGPRTRAISCPTRTDCRPSSTNSTRAFPTTGSNCSGSGRRSGFLRRVDPRAWLTHLPIRAHDPAKRALFGEYRQLGDGSHLPFTGANSGHSADDAFAPNGAGVIVGNSIRLASGVELGDALG